MCGIAGIVGCGGEHQRARFDRSLGALWHRGPDDAGEYEDPEALIGMRRLSIIDVEHGAQPIFDESGSIAVVCNGEIYNYVELFAQLRARGHVLQSSSDVNVIPHLYQEHGRDFVTPLRGMFAVALWDARERRLLLVRDRVGKKPLFWARCGEGLAFASELPALLALLERSPTLSLSAIADYVRLGFIPHPQTAFEGVRALPPGAMLEFRPGAEPQVRKYWHVGRAERWAQGREELKAELDDRLREAVRLRLRSDVPVGLFLSGGIDSGLVASYAAEEGATDLRCFVVDVEDDELGEAEAATAVARHLGLEIESLRIALSPLELLETVPRLFGQPFGDASALPTYLVARAARASRKVVLNGDGGDELFAGYRRYLLARTPNAVRRLAARLPSSVGMLGSHAARRAGRRSSAGFVSRALRGLAVGRVERYQTWTSDLLHDVDVRRVLPAVGGAMEPLGRLAAERDVAFATDGLNEFQQSDFQLILADDLVVKMDIATMANSIEARSPFLDATLAEFAWSIPEAWRIRGTTTKVLLRELARERLPCEIVAAPKRGFEVPVARWLDGELRGSVRELLADSEVGRLADRRALAALVGGTDGFAGNRVQTTWALLVLEQFLRNPVRSADHRVSASVAPGSPRAGAVALRPA